MGTAGRYVCADMYDHMGTAVDRSRVKSSRPSPNMTRSHVIIVHLRRLCSLTLTQGLGLPSTSENLFLSLTYLIYFVSQLIKLRSKTLRILNQVAKLVSTDLLCIHYSAWD